MLKTHPSPTHPNTSMRTPVRLGRRALVLRLEGFAALDPLLLFLLQIIVRKKEICSQETIMGGETNQQLTELARKAAR